MGCLERKKQKIGSDDRFRNQWSFDFPKKEVEPEKSNTLPEISIFAENWWLEY